MDFDQPEGWERYFDPEGLDEGEALDLRLPWSDAFELRLVVNEYGHELTLVRRTSADEFLLGWIDQVRSHPYALRSNELDMLLDRWRTEPDLPPVSHLFLLLAPFVGMSSDAVAEHERQRIRIKATYRELGFGNQVAAELTERLFSVVSEADYRWMRDPELGLVFGGKYSCYSMRNRDHFEGCGDDRRFPFAEFKTYFRALLASSTDPIAEPPPAAEPPDDPDWDTRTLCPDGACIGVIETSGRCSVCGREPSDVG